MALIEDVDGDIGYFTGKTITAAANFVLWEKTIRPGNTHLYFQVTNTHATSVAFDEFTIQRRVKSSASAWETLASIAADYTSPQVPLLEVQGAPVTLAQNASVHIRMSVEATDAIRILASGNAAETTAALYYRFQ